MAKFNKLDVPHQWRDEFTKYPHGYTIFEALCKWVKQVDNMVDNINNWNTYLDNFVENFEFELQEEVQSTIERWQSEGLLDGIIESALNTELDNVKTQLVESPKLEYEQTTILSFKDRFESQFINVKDFGAKGDGVTDDTNAIQNCIDYCIANNKPMYIPMGEYLHTGLIFEGRINVFGSGQRDSILKYNGTGIALQIGLDYDNAPVTQHSIYRDFGVIGNEDLRSECGIKIARTATSHFSNIYVRNFKTGVYIHGSEFNNIGGNVYNNTYDGLVIYDINTGFLVTGTITDSHFTLCLVTRCHKYGFHFKDNVRVAHNVTIKNCTAAGWTGDYNLKTSIFIDEYRFNNLEISGCDFENFTEYGIYEKCTTDAKCFLLNIHNNLFFSKHGVQSLCGIRFDKASRSIIYNNNFLNSIEVDIKTYPESTICFIFGNNAQNRSLIVELDSASQTYFDYSHTANQSVTQFESGISSKQGDIVTVEAGRGFVCTTPDGANKYRISVDNDGNIISNIV